MTIFDCVWFTSKKKTTFFKRNKRMFKRNVLITIALAVAISLSSAPCVQAAELRLTTTLNLATPIHGGIDTVVLNWSTNKTSGTVWGPDLLNYSLELSSVSLTYTDTIMVGDIIQPILGVVPRSNPWWHFNLNTLMHWR